MAASKAELDHEQRLRVYQYYCALRDFFDITGEKHDRSNSARAQKARSKLLKLYPSQFFELSTDVHDELQRRIDEHQTQPDHLLPRDNFHVKRNQARQKLANLSQMRFNDLVDDILYEIKRRDYNTEPEELLTGHSDTATNSSKTSSLAGAGNKIAPNATVQASQVIPKKASIDWSSDEEEKRQHDEISDVDSPNTPVLPQHDLVDSFSSPKFTKKSSLPESLVNIPLSPVSKKSQNEATKFDSHQPDVENSFSGDTPSVPSSPIKAVSSQNLTSPIKTISSQNSNSEARRTGSISRASLEHQNKDREIQVLVAEGTKMDQKITALERSNAMLSQKNSSLQKEANDRRAANDELVSEISDLKNKLETLEKSSLMKKDGDSENSPRNPLDDTHQKELFSMTKQLNSLSIENENLKQALAELEIKLKKANSQEQSNKGHTVHQLLKDGEVKTFDALPSEELLSDQILKEFISHEGLVPLSLIRSFNKHIEKIFGDIRNQRVSESFGDLLFEDIALISDAVHQIVTLTGTPDNGENIILLKASLSHAITAVRYFAIYHRLLPRITVESAIAGVSFAVCGLIKKVKVSKTETASDIIAQELPNTPKTPVESTHQFPARRFKNNLDSDFDDPREASSFIEEEPASLSPVKPLKITQKVVTNSTPTKNSNRKPSSSLFASIVTPNISRGSSPRSSRQMPSSGIGKPVKDHTEDLTKSTKMYSEVPSSAGAIIREPKIAVPLGKAIDRVHRRENTDEPTGVEPIQTDGSQEKENNSESQKLDEKEPEPLDDAKANQDTGSVKTTDITSQGQTTTAPENSTQHSLMDGIKATISNGFFGKAASASNNSQAKLNLALENENFSSEDDSQDDGFQQRIGESTTTSDEDFTYQALKENMKSSHSSKTNDPTRVVIAREVHRASNDCTDKGPSKVLNDDLNAEPETFTSEPLSFSSPTKSINMSNEAITESVPEEDKISIKQEEQITLPATTSKLHVPKPIVKVTEPEAEEPVKVGSTVDDTEPDFDIDAFDIENPDNTLSELLLYLEHRTIEVISTIQSLLTSIKQPKATTGELRGESNAISQVISQMVGATSVSMDQSRNASLKEHGNWVVQSLEDCRRRMTVLCHLNDHDSITLEEGDDEYADKHFKQRLAGIAFDVAKCTKELVKTVEEASLKEEIEFLNSRLAH